MWRQKRERPPPTYEAARLVAEVLSRVNAGLIERHFALSADTWGGSSRKIASAT
jgi:hypothetical protein